jgi:hypothetical protein
VCNGWLPSPLAQSPISNKNYIVPKPAKQESDFIVNVGWQGGYSFRQFLGNVYNLLGDLQHCEGIQQLIHHYYLQNGSVNARTTANRIKKFIGN